MRISSGVCRTCLKKNSCFELEFFKNVDPVLLSFCTSLEIQRDDSFTKYICKVCFKLLVEYSKFKRNCIQSHKLLAIAVKNKGTNCDPRAESNNVTDNSKMGYSNALIDDLETKSNKNKLNYKYKFNIFANISEENNTEEIISDSENDVYEYLSKNGLESVVRMNNGTILGYSTKEEYNNTLDLDEILTNVSDESVDDDANIIPKDNIVKVKENIVSDLTSQTNHYVDNGNSNCDKFASQRCTLECCEDIDKLFDPTHESHESVDADYIIPKDKVVKAKENIEPDLTSQTNQYVDNGNSNCDIFASQRCTLECCEDIDELFDPTHESHESVDADYIIPKDNVVKVKENIESDLTSQTNQYVDNGNRQRCTLECYEVLDEFFDSTHESVDDDANIISGDNVVKVKENIVSYLTSQTNRNVDNGNSNCDKFTSQRCILECCEDEFFDSTHESVVDDANIKSKDNVGKVKENIVSDQTSQTNENVDNGNSKCDKLVPEGCTLECCEEGPFDWNWPNDVSLPISPGDERTHYITIEHSYAITNPDNEVTDNHFKYKCPFCKKRYNHLDRLEIHKLTHQGQQEFYRCKPCNKIYQTWTSLKFHNDELHTTTPLFKCSVCNKLFSTKRALKKHLNTHSRSNFLEVCNVCGKEFKKASMIAHRETHLNNRKRECVCQQCGKMYFNSCSLQTHIKRTHDRRQFICHICSQAFADKFSLGKHIKGHLGIKPHSCDICKKSFLHLSGLKLHSRIHTGEKPFLCNVCEKAFINKKRLIEHLRIHTGERPHACKLCPSKFTQRGSLKRHMKIHNV